MVHNRKSNRSVRQPFSHPRPNATRYIGRRFGSRPTRLETSLSFTRPGPPQVYTIQLLGPRSSHLRCCCRPCCCLSGSSCCIAHLAVVSGFSVALRTWLWLQCCIAHLACGFSCCIAHLACVLSQNGRRIIVKRCF